MDDANQKSSMPLKLSLGAAVAVCLLTFIVWIFFYIMDMQLKALKKIFAFNVMKFSNGEMGAVNGMAPDGSIIKTNEQVQEVWTGTTFSLAALMLGDGMKDEGYRTAWGVYHVVYETKGYWFRTPEAYEIDGNFRASMYMRPAAIWAMEMTEPPSKDAAKANPAH